MTMRMSAAVGAPRYIIYIKHSLDRKGKLFAVFHYREIAVFVMMSVTPWKSFFIFQSLYILVKIFDIVVGIIGRGCQD